MAEQLDLAALRREREARRGKPAPVAAAASADASGGQRLDGEKVEAPPAKRARAGSSSGPVIYVGGALKDARGHHSLRPPAVPAAAYEVDCRRSSTEVKVTGRVATFAAGLGTLNDKKTGSDAERRHATEFLLRDAREIDLRRSRGEDTWVHCAQGFNRGPSGVLAYLLLYTDATFDQACDAVAAARPRARTQRNTFRAELLELAKRPKLKRADHAAVAIADGGNDPCDDSRRKKVPPSASG